MKDDSNINTILRVERDKAREDYNNLQREHEMLKVEKVKYEQTSERYEQNLRVEIKKLEKEQYDLKQQLEEQKELALKRYHERQNNELDVIGLGRDLQEANEYIKRVESLVLTLARTNESEVKPLQKLLLKEIRDKWMTQ